MSDEARESINRAIAEEREFLKTRHGGEEQDPIGMCMSGGGIRSAIFNLGILTVLEAKGFLKLADYLSTVSGGGYIGGYVMANRVNHREIKGDKDDPPLKHLRSFANYLSPSLGAFSADTWTMMMVWFRNTSLLQVFLLTVFGFLLMLPRIWGMFLREHLTSTTFDEWAVTIAIVIFHFFTVGVSALLINAFDPPVSKRSLFDGIPSPPRKDINIRGVFTVVLGLALIGATFFALGAFKPFERGGGPAFAELELQFSLTLGSCGFYLALFSLGFGRRFHPRAKRPVRLLWAFLTAFASIVVCDGSFGLHDFDMWRRIGMSAAIAALTIGVAWNRIFLVEDHEKTVDICRSLAAAAACGIVSVAGLYLSSSFHGDAARHTTLLANTRDVFAASNDLWNYALFAAPGLLATLGLCIIVLIGIAGRAMPDIVREAWSSLGAKLYMLTAALLLVGVIGIYGPMLILWAWVSWNSYVLASGGAATAIIGALSIFAANSGDTSGKKAGGSKLELFAKVGPVLFIVILFCGVAMAIHGAFVYKTLSVRSAACSIVPAIPKFEICAACVGLGERATAVSEASKFSDCPACASAASWNGPAWPSPDDLIKFHWQFMETSIRDQWWLTWSLLFALAAIALFLMFRLDINEFSINRFYRNRLVRCFLGAARTGVRKPDPITGFDFGDDLPMKAIAAHLNTSPITPVPIVNTALNAMGGQDAAMQERRAQSFAFTPFHAYSDATGAFDMTKLTTERNPGDVTLGTLIATSGAAANPNMGYHMSSPVAFLLTFFNVRLGWWLAIPPRLRCFGGWFKSHFNFAYIFFELFGAAETDDAYVNLSDGGHFENLGLYELVRRKCKVIIVGDGEQDDKYMFEALGMAVRKCRIDFGATIEIDVSPIVPAKPGEKNPNHWTVGDITYEDRSKGRIIYLKSSYTGREPYDVQQYKKQNEEFPQQSTGDQFFNESQLESYRQLGIHAATEMTDKLVADRNWTREQWIEGVAGLHQPAFPHGAGR
ncbi:MAG: hypothetical protein FJW38_00780 [Acidobacteria bacterium]|nr:hypothetical protein [Acidobacteriota bacterium]